MKTIPIRLTTYKFQGWNQWLLLMKDLGVHLDSKLRNLGHLDFICFKAWKVLGFLRKFTSDFRNCSVILNLYKSLVLPILLYSSPVSTPYLAYEKHRMESVQHKFLRYLAFKSGRPMHPHDHDDSPIMNRFKISSLSSQRNVKDVIFAFKLIHGGVDCADLSNRFIMRDISYNLRYIRPFEETTAGTNYRSVAQIPRLISTWHKLPPSNAAETNVVRFKRLVKLAWFKYEWNALNARF